MPYFDIAAVEPPELQVVRRVVKSCLAEEPGAIEAFRRCLAIEAYTDGSAPLANPGGPAGFGAVMLGFAEPVDATTSHRPQPTARIHLAGFIPERAEEPLTSNNRAEIAAVLAVLEMLRHLGRQGWTARQLFIWSDSDYVVKCGNGVWKRIKNTDLWPVYDMAAQDVAQMAPGGLVLRWVKGHASSTYNRVADELATRAAFDFDGTSYASFRGARAAVGHAPTNAVDVVLPEPVAQHQPDSADFTPSKELRDGRRIVGTDYTVLLCTSTGSQLRGHPATIAGIYRLEAKGGRSFQAEVAHSGQRIHDEAEYLTLIEALSNLLGRIEDTGRGPGSFSVKVYSCRQVVVGQLQGRLNVSSLLKPNWLRGRALLAQFGQREVAWKPFEEIVQELG